MRAIHGSNGRDVIGNNIGRSLEIVGLDGHVHNDTESRDLVLHINVRVLYVYITFQVFGIALQ